MKIVNFEHKRIIEKCVSCFLAYLFYGSLFFEKKKKMYYGLRDLNFCMKTCTKRIQYTLLITLNYHMSVTCHAILKINFQVFAKSCVKKMSTLS